MYGWVWFFPCDLAKRFLHNWYLSVNPMDNRSHEFVWNNDITTTNKANPCICFMGCTLRYVRGDCEGGFSLQWRHMSFTTSQIIGNFSLCSAVFRAYIKETLKPHVTGPLREESTGHRWIPPQRVSNVGMLPCRDVIIWQRSKWPCI